MIPNIRHPDIRIQSSSERVVSIPFDFPSYHYTRKIHEQANRIYHLVTSQDMAKNIIAAPLMIEVPFCGLHFSELSLPNCCSEC
jgi:hypothetical protein